MFEITGIDASGRVNLKRMTLESAVRKAEELLAEKYRDVQITGPDGQVYLPKQFHYL